MRKLLPIVPLLLVALLCGALSFRPARADEGMWTFNDFPRDKLNQQYGFSPDDKWLEHVQLASVRLAGGCSGGFVSAQGLVITNHHCVHDCVQDLSTADKDFVEDGFYAKTTADEPKCPAMEVDQLVAITTVTDRVLKAGAGLSDAQYNAALKAEKARIEKECATDDEIRCDVVTLYAGGRYDLYKYRRFQDVRLVFAPEFRIAFFGGDPENFTFPRFDLDMSFVRVYDSDAPATTEHFTWSKAGARDGELTFVPGNPGGTQRLLTVAQLEYERDVSLPWALLYRAELRGLLTEFQRRSAEAKRVSTDLLFFVENGYKARRGRLEALRDKVFMSRHEAEEQAFRAWVKADAARQQQYGGAWDAIAAAMVTHRALDARYTLVEERRGFAGDLFERARTLLRGGDERPKANDKRLEELTDANLPAVEAELFSTAPVSAELEIALLAFGLTKLREELGARDPLVKKVLGKDSPEEVATRVVQGTKLGDLAVRKQLWAGGKKAVAASKDPMIALARLIDGDARALRKQYEDKVEAVVARNGELIAKARFEREGASKYPDATFSPRLSYGQVKGYEERGAKVKPFTTFAGAFDLATGRDPYKLPDSWLKAKDAPKSKLKLGTPLDFVTTNDIIGGNSGSPMINEKAEIVGVVFDGNLQSLGGEYYFDPAVNRTVALHSDAMLHALSVIYGADRLVDELRGK